MTPTISVIVPHYAQKPLLRLCLAALEAQTMPRADYEVIVVDNGTPGGVDDVAADFPGVRFALAEEKGAAPARNAGLALARGAIIAFTDADCIAEPGWLRAGAAALNCADLAGGAVIVTADDERRLSPVEAFERVFAFRQKRYVEQKKFSVTANLFARREAADAIGPFTNRLSEDVDWCRRGVALGFRLAFNDTSIVRHPARRDWEALVRKWDRLVVERWNGVRMAGKAPRLRWLMLAFATALSPAPHAIEILFTRKLQTFRDRIAATMVLARIRWWRAARMIALLRQS